MRFLIVKRLVLASIVFIFGACISKKETWQSPIPSARAQTKKSNKKTTKKRSSESAERTLVHSKKMKKLQKRQAMRLSKVEYYKIKKFIGEKEDGLLGVRTSKGLSKSEKRKMQKVVTEENKDREILYSEVVKKNKVDKKMQVVMRKNFFDSYQAWSPKGGYYYLNGKWQTKGQ